MPRLFLMRHAEAQPGPGQQEGALFSTGDHPLSKTGRREALGAGELLAEAEPGITGVHTSPAVRCRETARIAAGELSGDHEPQVHDDLLEVPYAEPGATYDDILTAIVNTTRLLREEDDPELPTGVSWQEATGRFAAALERIVDGEERPLVVAHGAQNRAWLTDLLGMPAYRMFLFEQDHACINVVGFSREGRPAVQKLNVTPDPLATQASSFADG